MPSKLKLLVISHTFPPDSQVGGLRPARFCQYLPEFGIEPIVLTIREEYCPARDHSLTLAPDLQVYRTRVLPTPLDFYGNLKRRFSSREPSGKSSPAQLAKSSPRESSGGLKWHLHALLRIPDDNWGWYHPAVAEASQVIRDQKIDAILSTSPPVIAHLIARRLKKKFGLPWLIDFRDPWTHNIDVVKMPPWHERLSARLEADCIRRADLIICNTDRLREMFAGEYSGLDPSRFVTVTNGFIDPSASRDTECSNDKEIVALHLGSIYGERRVDNFASALTHLSRAGRLDPNLRVKFVGPVDPELVEAIERGVPEILASKMLQFLPRVPFEEGQRLLLNAKLLLLFQGDHVLQVPAKFYEYLQAGKPIFAVARRGALTDLIDRSGSGVWAEPGDIATIGEALVRALQMAPLDRGEVKRRYNMFHYRSVTGVLAEHICRVVNSRASAVPQAQGSSTTSALV